MKALPTKIKQLKGTFNVTKERRSMKDPKGYCIENGECPDWVHEYGQEQWTIMFPQVNILEILRVEDLPGFAMMCNAYGEARHLTELIHKEGFSVKGRLDAMVGNPNVRARNDAQKLAIQLSKEFNIFPGVRAALNLKMPVSGESVTDHEFDDV